MVTKYNLPETNEMITKLLRFQALFINTERTEGEQTEYNQLLEDLEPYQVRADDFNNKLDKDGKAADAEKADSAGTAGTADKLKTARKITLSGDATGEIDFDGSANKTLTVAVKNHVPITGGTMTGKLVAQANAEYAVSQVHNAIVQPLPADISKMPLNSFWFQYE